MVNESSQLGSTSYFNGSTAEVFFNANISYTITLVQVKILQIIDVSLFLRFCIFIIYHKVRC